MPDGVGREENAVGEERERPSRAGRLGRRPRAGSGEEAGGQDTSAAREMSPPCPTASAGKRMRWARNADGGRERAALDDGRGRDAERLWIHGLDPVNDPPCPTASGGKSTRWARNANG